MSFVFFRTDTFWLTYWSCYGLLFLIMDWLETYLVSACAIVWSCRKRVLIAERRNAHLTLITFGTQRCQQGVIWGFYSVIIFSTVYLMLPMFQGSDKLFRNVLVPLAGLRESLLLRDALLLKKDLMASLPPERQIELRKLITYSFNTETPDDDDDDDAHDTRVEVSAANAKKMLLWSKRRKRKRKRRRETMI